MLFILRKLLSPILLLIKLIKQGLCCFRNKRYNSQNLDENTESLTHIGIIPNKSTENTWNDKWGNDLLEKTPQSVSEHIAHYRDKRMRSDDTDPSDIIVKNMFQELEPTSIKQKRVMIGSQNQHIDKNTTSVTKDRLAVDNNFSGDLQEWIEETTTGWDEQVVDPLEIIKQQKKNKLTQKSQEKKENTIHPMTKSALS